MTLEARSLVRRFPDGTFGLNGASLALETPCFAILSGRNGSGKSLLARHFLGLEQAQSGEVLLDGVPLFGGLASARKKIALVFQEPEHQILGITVAEDVAFGPRSAGMKPAERGKLVADSLERAGLQGFDNKLTASLSGGEKRRLAVASAMAGNPSLVILDEPFNDLDWDGASSLLGILLGLVERGIGILIVSHDLEKCLAHAGRLIVMDKGVIIRDGTPAQLWDELPALGLRRLAGGLERLPEMTWLKAKP